MRLVASRRSSSDDNSTSRSIRLNELAEMAILHLLGDDFVAAASSGQERELKANARMFDVLILYLLAITKRIYTPCGPCEIAYLPPISILAYVAPRIAISGIGNTLVELTKRNGDLPTSHMLFGSPKWALISPEFSTCAGIHVFVGFLRTYRSFRRPPCFSMEITAIFKSASPVRPLSASQVFTILDVRYMIRHANDNRAEIPN